MGEEVNQEDVLMKELNDAKETVKQTIVESLHAPRLSAIDTSDFVSFKERRKTYERKVEEKSLEQKVKICTTSYRNSIDDSLLQIFIIVGSVSETDVEGITEESIKKCIDERSKGHAEQYELAVIEKQLPSLQLDTKVRTLENRVWKLSVAYHKMLEDIGYSEFTTKKPQFAVNQFMSRITYVLLKRRINSI